MVVNINTYRASFPIRTRYFVTSTSCEKRRYVSDVIVMRNIPCQTEPPFSMALGLADHRNS